MNRSDVPMRDDETLFELICKSLSAENRSVAEIKFGKGKENLEKKWEGYHIHEYASSIYGKNKKIEIEFDRALKNNGFDFGRNVGLLWVKRIASSASVHDTKVRAIFKSLAEVQENISDLELLLGFFKYCEKENLQLEMFDYDDEHLKDAVDNIETYIDKHLSGDTENSYDDSKNQNITIEVKQNIKSRFQLVDSNHPLLSPREAAIGVIGRDNEIAEVVSFLNSSASYSHVAGKPGIGKTEVCKAALKEWLNSENPARAFFVKVSDNADAIELLDRLGEAVGLAPDICSKISGFSQLYEHLPAALYYLDNIENVADSNDGCRLLRELTNTPYIRILASSRVDLSRVFGKPIVIDSLNTDSACELFRNCWQGRNALDQNESLRRFIDKELGGHTLSVVLLAHIGRAYSNFEELTVHWEKLGTSLPKVSKSNDRIDSLEISFALTRMSLAKVPGALDLWQFIALFSDGCDEEILNLWEETSKRHQARLALAEHHLYSVDGQTFTMLPPIARYALDQMSVSESSENYFNWCSARGYAYRTFTSFLNKMLPAINKEEGYFCSSFKIHREMWAITKLLIADSRSGAPHWESIKKIRKQLSHAGKIESNVDRTNSDAGISYYERDSKFGRRYRHPLTIILSRLPRP